MTEAADTLTQERGARSGEMLKLGGPGGAVEFHAKHVRWLEHLPSSKITEQERSERLEAAALRAAYLGGDPEVTREAATLAEMRVAARWWLRLRSLPMTEFPEQLSAVSYARGRHCIEIAHEKPDPSEAALRINGRSVYQSWYRPIERYYFGVVRLCSGLGILGDRSDNRTCRELLSKGHALSEWLSVRFDTERIMPATANDIPFLPRWSIRALNGDRWWWGDWRGLGLNVIEWWERWTA